ncbi:hypothetical protein GGI26_003269 [Coemansia sp. RSA 1358]|nr:hypothetical protein GGI26_003269 [Coemansia sp. RSA 1358]
MAQTWEPHANLIDCDEILALYCTIKVEPAKKPTECMLASNQITVAECVAAEQIPGHKTTSGQTLQFGFEGGDACCGRGAGDRPLQQRGWLGLEIRDTVAVLSQRNVQLVRKSTGGHGFRELLKNQPSAQ